MYRYKAIDLKGKTIKGMHNAMEKTEVIKSLRNNGYFILECKLSYFRSLKKLFQKKGHRQIAIFCRQLYEILKSGIDLNKGLNILSNQKFSTDINTSINEIKNDIKKGKTLSEGLAKFPNVFPEFMVSMIKIGEQSGNLEKVLLNLYQYYMNEHNTSSKIKSLMIYPSIVLVTTLCITIFIITKIIPNILDNITTNNIPITKEIKRIIIIRNFLLSKWSIAVVILLITILMFLKFKVCKNKRFNDVRFNLPIIKKFYKELFQIRFIKNLSMLISSGVPIITALRIIERDLKVNFYKEKITNLIVNIREGADFSTSLEKTNLFNDFFISMTMVGEETGSMERMLDNAAEIYEENMKETIRKLSTYIEPITMIFLAGVITIVIINFVFPILDIMNSVEITI
ncbi:type II secretion system F family protein [Clostridium sp. MB40-C1]|uniref:type II secretion system F family protein n=1 Tax=Clostridium sp. MB40-C1 TaxID=3070996 RepID=UPI0027E0096E|nr:type II secretion system F family protein [Clostridium sp. MB40-C1]WMJ81387.1 type II secretion system F family protein [Clostridium sp. MB40-C1]